MVKSPLAFRDGFRLILTRIRICTILKSLSATPKACMKRSGKQGNRNLIIKKDELNFITKAMGCQGEIILRATPSSP